jgi:hypothetical protein
MANFKAARPRNKRISGDGKRCIKLNKKMQNDLLSELKDKLEDDHIKKYTFIVKGSKLYTQGVFWSDKNKVKYVFRSTYEFAFFYLLESDPLVSGYIVEPFEVEYIDPRDKTITKIYRPDVLVRYTSGVIKLLEIKPKRKIHIPEVRAKAEGARKFLKENFPDIKYEFITEEEIFKEPGDYLRLLGRIDPEKYNKRIARGARSKEPKPLRTITDKKELDYVKSKLPKAYKYAPFMLI